MATMIPVPLAMFRRLLRLARETSESLLAEQNRHRPELVEVKLLDQVDCLEGVCSKALSTRSRRIDNTLLYVEGDVIAAQCGCRIWLEPDTLATYIVRPCNRRAHRDVHRGAISVYGNSRKMLAALRERAREKPPSQRKRKHPAEKMGLEAYDEWASDEDEP